MLNFLLHALLFHAIREEDPLAAQLAERVTYTSDDGETLSSYWLAAGPERLGTIVYFHGNAATAAACVPWATDLQAEGYDVLVAEYRGYGASTGRPTARGVELDGDAAFRYLLERNIEASQIVVYGESLGGAVATHVLAGVGNGARAGILQSTFSSLHAMARSMVVLPLTYLVPDAYALDSEASAPRLTMPTLSFHGDRDSVIPFALGQALYRALGAGGPHHFIRVEGADHGLPAEAVHGPMLRFLRDPSQPLEGASHD